MGVLSTSLRVSLQTCPRDSQLKGLFSLSLGGNGRWKSWPQVCPGRWDQLWVVFVLFQNVLAMKESLGASGTRVASPHSLSVWMTLCRDLRPCPRPVPLTVSGQQHHQGPIPAQVTVLSGAGSPNIYKPGEPSPGLVGFLLI